MVPFAAGETVIRIRAPLVTDRYGNQVFDWDNATRSEVSGCGVAPRTSDEETETGRQGVIVGITVYVPAGTDISAHDRMEVRGEVYEVAGEVADWRSPFTGWAPGLVVNLRRVEG